MAISAFLGTTGNGLARAELDSSGGWTVDLLSQQEKVNCVCAHATNHDMIYAGTQGNGVLCSQDRGKTWQAAGLSGKIVKSLAVSKMQPDTIYAGCKPPMIFVSHDTGQTWAELEGLRPRRQWWWFIPAETPFNQPYVQGLAVSPTDPNNIVAGIELGAVLHSTDGGKTWSTHRNGAIRDCHYLKFHVNDGNYVYEGGGSGAAYSRDGGATWIQPDPLNLVDSVMFMLNRASNKPQSGLDRRYGWAVAADPQQPDIWYCSCSIGPMFAHSGNGDARAHIYRSRNGSNWERLSGGLPSPLPYMPYGLLTDPDAPGHLYAGMSNGDIWHTQDYGDTWVQLPVNMGTIYAAMIGV